MVLEITKQINTIRSLREGDVLRRRSVVESLLLDVRITYVRIVQLRRVLREVPSPDAFQVGPTTEPRILASEAYIKQRETRSYH